MGGTSEEHGFGIAVDGSGNAYVTGDAWRAFADFPTLNAFQPTSGGGFGDAFVTKYNSSGTMLFSTYLGGDGPDVSRGISVDSTGHAYVTGETQSATFPTLNASQAQRRGNTDAFVTKLNANGTLSYSTYLGGIYEEWGTAITVDGDGNTVVTGQVNDGGLGEFPIFGTLCTNNPNEGIIPPGNGDAYIVWFSPSGSHYSLDI